MPRFRATGKNRKTGRPGTRTVFALTEERARAKAIAHGIDVSRIVVVPDDPPSDRQIAYARDLGLAVPSWASMGDVSELIRCRVEGDKLADERDVAIVHALEIDASRLMGEKALFERIFDALKQPGNELELVAWFTLCVYRSLGSRRVTLPGVDTPRHPMIQRIANALASDPGVRNSIRRYSGDDLFRFGEWTDSQGEIHGGGNTKTLAYKKCAEQLSVTQTTDRW